MHQEINNPEISKVYACAFRPVKSPFEHISLELLVKFINLR